MAFPKNLKGLLAQIRLITQVKIQDLPEDLVVVLPKLVGSMQP
jgi:hypothetical protein